MVWLLDLLQRQSVPIILSTLILFPFLTHYITTLLFYRKQRSKARNGKPPTIPYGIPGVFHALGLLSRPPAYFALLVKKYGEHAPFVVKVGWLSYVVVRDPEHVQKVFRISDDATNSDLVEFYSKVLNAPKEAVECYQSMGTGTQESEKMRYVHGDLAQKHFTDSALKSLTETYVTIFHRNMSNKMFQVGTWTQIEDVWSFFEIDITRATTETLFGSALLKQYPKLARDLGDFNSKVEDFLPGLPRFMVSSSIPPRDRLLDGMKKWLQTHHGGTDFAKMNDDDPMWNEEKGSKFIQERDNVFANMPSFNYQARAVESLSILHSLTSLTTPSTIWSVVEALRNPALGDFLTAEFAPHHDPKLATYDIPAITKLPNMQSLHTEIRRLRSATRLIHTTHKNTSITLNDSNTNTWTVPPGTSIITFSQDLSLNTSLWSKMQRPQIVARPLEDFWPERFLIPDKSTSTKRYRKDRDSVTTGTFSLDGIEALHAGLGGSNYTKPEQAFAAAVQSATLAVLLTEFEIELCDPEAVEEAMPPLREVAYGVVRPMEKIAVRVRKRGDRGRRK